MNFTSNPLFRQFERQAREEFRKSAVGKLMQEVQRGSATPSGVQRVGRLLKDAARQGRRPSLSRLGGKDFGKFASEIEKYARGGGYAKQLVNEFLGQMGAAGKLIGALIGGNVQSKRGLEREIGTAFEFLRVFKPELLSDQAKRGDVGETTSRGNLKDAEYLAKLLEAQGYEVVRPGVKEPKQRRKTADVDLGEGRTRRFPRNHPIITGEMVPTPQSSNVHSFGYDNSSSYLYVRFKAAKAPGAKGPRPQSPGSLYRYAHVMPEKFLGMYQAHSKGTWIWDNIRQRGTVSGHTHSWELVGITAGYVPRRAVYRGKDLGEWYMPRTVRGEGAKRLTSRLSAEPLTGAPNTGAPAPPNTGAP